MRREYQSPLFAVPLLLNPASVLVLRYAGILQAGSLRFNATQGGGGSASVKAVTQRM
jgi:hypothetical protein